jgi:hypothetical protein
VRLLPSGRRRWSVVLGLIVLLVLAIAFGGRRHSAACTAHRLPKLTAGDTQLWLLSAIVAIPCPSTGRAVYHLRDSRHEPAGVLDPIDDPRGGYLGVYHSEIRSGPGGKSVNFEVSLAHSTDLVHWSWIRTLDPAGASMATLQPVPGGGYLLAYEKRANRVDFIRMRYYRSLAGLESGGPAASLDLPLRFSREANGTPSFLGVAWHGSLRRSVLAIAFHYLTRTSAGWVDREAIGVLRGFRHWSAQPDTTVDGELERLGFVGSHGDLRQFSFGGSTWRVYEAQDQARGSWHVLLYDVAARHFQPLRLNTASGRYATSFGNPIVRVLRAPGGRGRVLVTTVFVFNTGGSASGAGELLYYQPLG